MKTVTYDETKWKLVPIELTQEMLDSVDDVEVGGSCFSCTKWTASYADATNMWSAMLSAAPAYNGKKDEQ